MKRARLHGSAECVVHKQRMGDVVIGRSPVLFSLFQMHVAEYDASEIIRANMPQWVWVVGFIALYIVLTQWLLPKLGVPT